MKATEEDAKYASNDTITTEQVPQSLLSPSMSLQKRLCIHAEPKRDPAQSYSACSASTNPKGPCAQIAHTLAPEYPYGWLSKLGSLFGYPKY